MRHRNFPPPFPLFGVGGSRTAPTKPSARGGRTLAILALGALLALPLTAGEARAQANCVPTQTVSAEPVESHGGEATNPEGPAVLRYVTTIECPDLRTEEGEVDYRRLHYNQGPSTAGGQVSAEDRDASIDNNLPNNDVSLTIRSGVVFNPVGGQNLGEVPHDGAIVLWRGGAKTLVVEEGAVINLQATPGSGCCYGGFGDILNNLTAIYLETETGAAGDLTARFNGELNVSYRVHGSWSSYQSNAQPAINLAVIDRDNGPSRARSEILLELGPSAVVRLLEGSAGLGGVAGRNESEEGGITFNFAKGSLIDTWHGGGYVAVQAFLRGSGNNAGRQTGDIVINAAGTIRNAVRNRTISQRQGIGIRTINDGWGATRVTSSGLIETFQANAMFLSLGSGDSAMRDDPTTEEIEGNLVDVTAGMVHARGSGAINLDIWSPDSAWTVRVGEGATVRAEFDAGPHALGQGHFGGGGNWYIFPNSYYSWRRVDTNNDGNGDSWHPIVFGIYIVRHHTAVASDDAINRVIVHGTVETVGGLAGEDAAVFLREGGTVAVGRTGRVTSDSGLAIATGNAGSDNASSLSVMIAGMVTGDVAARDNGDLIAQVTEGGTVNGDLTAMGDGDLTATIDGTVSGELRTEGDGDFAATVSGTVSGNLRAEGDGDLTALVTAGGTVEGDVFRLGSGELRVEVREGGAIEGTVRDPTVPMTVHGAVGRIELANGGMVTIAATGRLTGVEGAGESLRSLAGDLRVSVEGAAAGGIRSDGDMTATVSGRVTGGVRGQGAMRAFVTGTGAVEDGIRSEGDMTASIAGRVTGGLLAEGDLSADVSGVVAGGIRGMGALSAVVSGVVDGNIEAPGAGEHSVTVSRGGVVTGEIHLAASAVRVDGSVGAARFDGDGTVDVGPEGVIRGVDGSAVRAGGALRVALALNGRRVRDILGGDLSADGGTTLFVNGMNASAGVVDMPNGAWDITLPPVRGGRFAVADVVETLAPRVGVYESLPGLLLRVESGRKLRAKTTAEGSPVWARASTLTGWRSLERSSVGADYDFDSYGAEAGLDARFPRAPGFTGSISVRYEKGSAEVGMPVGEGEIELTGLGPAAGLSWENRAGWYVNGGFTFMSYEADLSTTERGALKSGAGANVLTADAAVGRRLEVGMLSFTPRAWIAHSQVSVDSFTDAVGARFRLEDGARLTAGGGLIAEIRGRAIPRWALGGELSLRGSADFESVLTGKETVVSVSGERLEAEAASSRVLLALGAHWRRGPVTLGGEFIAAPGSDDEAYGGRLSLGLRF